MFSVLINLIHRLSMIPIIGAPFRILFFAITGKTRHMPNERGAVVPRKLLIGRIMRTVAFLLFVIVAFFGYQLLKPADNQPAEILDTSGGCLLYTSPSPRDRG